MVSLKLEKRANVMNFKKKILPGIISIGLTISGLGIITPSFAGGKHHGGGGGHHHGGGGHHHGGGGHHGGGDHYHHHHNGLAIGLGIGALFGAVAIASAESGPGYYHNGYYHHDCCQVMTQRRCYTNQWGDYICHRVRYVRNVC
jgi:hypothetical protein